MDVDNVVFVDSLSDADESDEDEKLIFIPDIEKRMTKIPEHVLRAPGAAASATASGPAASRASTDLVLYSVPKSLTVEEGGIDGVRKAIIESRARLRLKREAEEAAAAAATEAERVRSAEMDGLQRMSGMGGFHVLGGSSLMNGMDSVHGMHTATMAGGSDPDEMEMDIE